MLLMLNRSVMQLFLMASKDNKSPVVMESVLLPCLKILQSLIKPDQPGSKKNKVIEETVLISGEYSKKPFTTNYSCTDRYQ